jgi:FtsH-binding integral membrane protein
MVAKNSRLWGMLLVGVLPILLILAAFLGAVVSGQANLDEWKLPLLAMVGIGVFTILLLGTLVGLMVVGERRAIAKLINGDYWAKWMQYEDETEWHDFAEREVETVRENNKFSWLFVFVVLMIYTFITGFTLHLFNTAQDKSTNPLVGILPITAMFIFILISGLGQTVMARRRGEALYRRRMSQPAPAVYIGARGLYHEDAGYSMFRGLNERLVEVKYVPQHRTLNFKISHRSRYGSSIETVRVRVPPSAKDEAEAIEQRLIAEVMR